MLQQHFITDLLKLQGVIVTNTTLTNNILHIHLDQEKIPCKCPHCNTITSKIHDYRKQVIKDVPHGNTTVYLVLNKRRLYCPNCLKSFIQKPPFLSRYFRRTRHLTEFIAHHSKGNNTFTNVAKMANVSTHTVRRIFNTLSVGSFKLPEVLSIDEFKGNAGGQKYQCVLTSPIKKKVLDILPNRDKSSLIDYFSSFKDKKSVKFFVMDMWEPYKSLAKQLFPQAIICIDKYHYVRQVYWALERVRKKEQKKFNDEDRIYFKRSRKLLTANYDSLDYYTQIKVDTMLNKNKRIYQAWLLKEMFTDFRKAKTRSEGERLLNIWLIHAKESNLPEFKDAITAFENWKEYILNAVEYGYNNAFTEGINNKIKVIKRMAYGFRNFNTFRNKILLACS